jgi:hypothetical protein
VDVGFLGLTDYYLASAAVSEVRGAAILVNTNHNDLDAKGWAPPPSGQYATETSERDMLQLRDEELASFDPDPPAPSSTVGKAGPRAVYI